MIKIRPDFIIRAVELRVEITKMAKLG